MTLRDLLIHAFNVDSQIDMSLLFIALGFHSGLFGYRRFFFVIKKPMAITFW